MAKDPYRYFRIEAQELVEALARGLLALEQGGDGRAIVRELLRSAHTLKGAARVVKLAPIGALAHKIEDLLEPLRESAEPVGPGVVDAALALLDEIRAGLAGIGLERPATAPIALPAASAAQTPAAPEPHPRDEAIASVRIGIGELDGLVEAVAESVAAVSALRRELAELIALTALAAPSDEAKAIAGAARAALDRGDALATATAEVRVRATELRLVPAGALGDELERSVRDAARSLDKPVAFRCSGHDLRIDAAVLGALRGPLRHIVRNAVAHGIEDILKRQRAGKPAQGLVEIAFRREGNRVVVTCRDDGGGLDLDALRAAAIARGLPAADAAALDEHGIVELLLGGGLTTRAHVDDVAGRGVGLDVVRAAIAAMRGEVAISSTRAGTLVTLRVPLSLSAMPALSVEADGRIALIALDDVRHTLRIGPDDVLRTPDGEQLSVDGARVPLVSLATLLGARAAARSRSAVVVASGDRLAAIGVDRVGAIETVVVKRLPPDLPVDPIVAAASLDEEGRPRLVLASAHLVSRAQAARPEPVVQARARKPVLVVDDSLTTRMLEQSILESAGYEVDTAVSAEDALAKIRGRRYGVMVVDVEMPGMSGFELLEHMQRDPALSGLPAILVTSRNDEADVRRGLAAGARAYIVKADFDQRRLLEAVEGLVA